jgi:hypothetical protein
MDFNLHRPTGIINWDADQSKPLNLDAASIIKQKFGFAIFLCYTSQRMVDNGRTSSNHQKTRRHETIRADMEQESHIPEIYQRDIQRAVELLTEAGCSQVFLT